MDEDEESLDDRGGGVIEDAAVRRDRDAVPAIGMVRDNNDDDDDDDYNWEVTTLPSSCRKNVVTGSGSYVRCTWP